MGSYSRFVDITPLDQSDKEALALVDFLKGFMDRIAMDQATVV